MSRTHIALVAGISVAASLLTPIAASADEPTTCENPGYTVKEGTLNWGIKTTWRKYVLNPMLTEGRWSTTKNVTNNDGNKRGDDYQFIFPVDAANTMLSVDKDGNLQGAVVETEPNGISFIGHPVKKNPGQYALSSTFISPYVHINGSKASAGTSYVGYYVPGKNMEQYTDEDRIPSNRVEGKDTFTDGTVKDFTITPGAEGSKDVTISFTSQDMMITPQEGTNRDEELVEGVDIVFMGQYNAEYKPEFDPFTVTLKATETCLDADQATKLKEEVQKDTLPSEYAVERGGKSMLSDKYQEIFNTLHSVSTPKDPTPKDPTPTPKPTPNEDELGPGAIAGIVIGAILGLLALLGVGAAVLNPGLLASFRL